MRYKHHEIAIAVVEVTAGLIVLDGWLFSLVQHIPFWHGLYCIWMTAITVGGDIQPVHQGYICLALAPVLPLGAAFSLFTSALASIHVRESESRIMKSVADCVPQPETG